MRYLMAILPMLILSCTPLQTEMTENRLVVQADAGEVIINRNIYGHFAEHLGRCIYGGFWVGENSPIPNIRGYRQDVIEALREIDPPVIRWPGGCFADTYHWKDGIGPRDERPVLINYAWGGTLENNSFGTHEFLDLCELLGAEPYLCVNVGSGTVQEAADWVEYVNASTASPMADLRQANGRQEPWKVKYWAVGNESWGCGGNFSAADYISEFKRYATFMHPGEYFNVASGGLDADYDWTRTVLSNRPSNYWHQILHGYSFHFYSVYPGWEKKGSATDFGEEEWFHMMRLVGVMEEHLQAQIAVFDSLDPEGQVALIADEWGNWYEVEPGTNPAFLYQQSTLRDAITTALYLDVFNRHAKRVKMANIAQTINVLQSLLLTREAELVRTPTFYTFKMYKVHQDATLLPSKLRSVDYRYGDERLKSLSSTCSRDDEGTIHVSVTNIDPHQPQELSIEFQGLDALTEIHAEQITADSMQAYNDFGQPGAVNMTGFDNFQTAQQVIATVIPAHAIITFSIETE